MLRNCSWMGMGVSVYSWLTVPEYKMISVLRDNVFISFLVCIRRIIVKGYFVTYMSGSVADSKWVGCPTP